MRLPPAGPWVRPAFTVASGCGALPLALHLGRGLRGRTGLPVVLGVAPCAGRSASPRVRARALLMHGMLGLVRCGGRGRGLRRADREQWNQDPDDESMLHEQAISLAFLGARILRRGSIRAGAIDPCAHDGRHYDLFSWMRRANASAPDGKHLRANIERERDRVRQRHGAVQRRDAGFRGELISGGLSARWPAAAARGGRRHAPAARAGWPRAARRSRRAEARSTMVSPNRQSH